MSCICLVWPRLGPYHLARVRGTHARWVQAGGEAVALDVASNDALYDWDVEDGPTAFRREVAFPGRSYHDVPPAEMEAGVTAALDRIDADAVAVPSYSTPDARAVISWCRKNRRTAVMLFESRAGDVPRNAVREAVKRALVHEFDACLASGDEHAAYAVELGMSPDVVVTGMSVVDNEALEEGTRAARRDAAARRALPGLNDDGPFFLASNRFIERKNLAALVRAYAVYRQRAQEEGLAPWRLVLLGDGDGRAALEALAGPDVVFAGFQQSAALPHYYAAADAFVHPALADQWGLVVNEAAVAGLPLIVSTATGAAPDLVKDGANGYLFEATDEAALSDAMGRVAALTDSERAAFGMRSRELVSAFTPETFGEAMWEAVRLGEPRSSRGPSLQARLVLGAIRAAARDTQSFHTVEG